VYVDQCADANACMMTNPARVYLDQRIAKAEGAMDRCSRHSTMHACLDPQAGLEIVQAGLEIIVSI